MDDSHLNSGSEMPDNYDLGRRRHSVASTSGGLEVPYSAFSTPPMLHSSSLSPASMLPPPVSQSHGLMGRTGPSQPTYADDLSSLRLPPLHLPNQQSSAGLALPTPPSSSRTLTFGTRSPSNDYSGEPKFSSYRTHSHTPTPSSSSLSSNQSQASSTSQTSSSNLHYGQPTNGKNRGNPMSISSLLNEGMKLEDKATYKEDTSMDIDDTVATKAEDSHVTMGDFTPFSSEQTIRRLSPPPALPVSSTKEMRKGSESRPTSSRVVKEEWSSGGRHSSENSRKTPSAPSSSSRRAIDVKRSSERTTRDKGAKAWQANTDLSNMDVESESE
ncbi:hypothetical protein CPB86DRAFT_114086 [Serendipita vermifera]|nr:hypothetical protein CPB86DRAFT_114086 [Serendipita vermifera]